jgi:hypothetical protein
VDASFAVHPDFKSHTGAIILLVLACLSNSKFN